MAEYRFEANPDGVGETTFTIDRWKYAFFDQGITYREEATGQLVVADMTDIEREAVKRGIFAPQQLHGNHQVNRSVTLDEGEQVAKLGEIVEGSLVTAATYSSSGRMDLKRDGRTFKGPEVPLNTGVVRSYAGNMALVRSVMLLGIQKEYLKDGQADEQHFMEVATVADRMSREILEVVTEPLIAVYGLTREVLQERLMTEPAGIH